MQHDSPAQQIDLIIKKHSGWKGALIAHLRTVILSAHDEIVEEVKWKMRSRPEGLPVWSCDGIVCFAEIWKDNVKLLFPKGVHLKDPDGLFNARLNSSEIRAIEFREADAVHEAGLRALVIEALQYNVSKSA